MSITLKNVNAEASSDISDVWWGLPALNTIQGTSGAIANGGDSGMGRFPAASDITPSIPSLPNVLLDSDQGVDGAVKGRPTETITAVITGGVIDQIYAAAVSNRLIKEEGPHDYLGGSLLCLAHNPTAYVINRPGRVRDTGANYGDAGYEVTEVFSALADVKQFNQVGRTVQGTQMVELAAAHVGKTLWGETITAVNYGVTRLWGIEPYFSEYPVTYHTFVGDNATVVFTLDVTAASADGDALQIWVDGVKLVYTTNYTVVPATGVVTLVAAPAAAAVVVAKVMYVPGC